MGKEEFLSRLECVENLPTLPAVVEQIRKLSVHQKSNMEQIATVIASDQAITARVIRLINSAFYGLGRKVTSIQHAIVLLGLNTVRNLVTGVSVVKMFENYQETSVFNREKFWLHTFACALGARAIGREMNAPEPDDFFLSGLLHDIGILVLDQFFHEEFIQILNYSIRNMPEYIHAEQAILELTHQEVGEFMARKWKIPEILVHAIRYHHDPHAADETCTGSAAVICAVHIADVMAINRGMCMLNTDGKEICRDVALKVVGVTKQRIDELFDIVEMEVETVAAQWGV